MLLRTKTHMKEIAAYMHIVMCVQVQFMMHIRNPFYMTN